MKGEEMQERNPLEKLEGLSRELREVQRLRREWYDEYLPVFKLEKEVKPLPPAKTVTPEARKRL